MATPGSPTRTWPDDRQEEAHVPQPDEGREIYSVALQRLPVFSQRENPTLWFVRAEAAMFSAKVTSDASKYSYLVSLLDPDSLNLVADIVTAPPATEKFRVLKERLLELYGQSEETIARNLLKTCRMGDEKPSHFLQRLRGLARNNVSDAVLKNIFLEQVPRSMHDILIASETTGLNKLASLADRLAEFQAPQVASLEQHRVAAPAPQSSVAARDDHVTTLMIQQLAELTREVSALKVQHQSRPRWRGRSPSNAGRSPAHSSRSRSRSSERNNGACYYHRRFGANANRCIIPCTWTTASVGNNSNPPSEN